jgi:hypothetical protein
MRRLLLAALVAVTPFAPAARADAVCVATAGHTACPVSTCSANTLIRVTVYGHGTGSVSCGGATASCSAFFGLSCTADARTTASGTLTCTSVSAVAVCGTVVES